MDSSLVFTHLAFGFVWAGVLHYAQMSKSLPWVTQKTTALNIAFRTVMALLTGLGIHGAYSGGAATGWQIAISIPSLAVLGHSLVQVIGQYATQQGWLTALQLQQFIKDLPSASSSSASSKKDQ
jgi:hypothetical protein